MAMDGAESLNAIKEYCKQVTNNKWGLQSIDVHLKPLGEGLNFLSDAYFVTIISLDGKSTTKRLFAKVPPCFDPQKKILFDTISDTIKPFEKEYFFYNIYEAKLKEFVEECNEEAEGLLDILPESYQISGELSLDRALKEPILLPDLGAQGYSMWADEFGGMDIQHAARVMQGLGTFHGLGASFVANRMPFEETIYNDLINLDVETAWNEQTFSMVDMALKTFIEWMEKNGFDEKATDNLKKMAKDRNYFNLGLESEKYLMENSFQSICHGDSRANNFMFKYDKDGKSPLAMKIVDFQLVSKYFPMLDLLYFLLTSVPADVLIEEFRFLMQLYHQNLVGVMARLNYPGRRPTLCSLINDLKKAAILGFTVSCSSVVIVLGGNTQLTEKEKDAKITSVLKISQFLDII